MKIRSIKKKMSIRRAILPASIIAAMAMSGSANAFKFDVGNPDIETRWDNTFRYNAGWRAQDAASYQGGQPEGSNTKWKSGDMVTDRLDVLSEFDFVYQKNTGFRLSAAGWYDNVYSGNSAPKTPYPDGKWPNEIKRYYAGPSGEWLDAFVFTKFYLGEVPVNVKLGQHTIYWGEALFSITNAISAGQAPLDLKKAVATPGIEAKEVFLPLNQLSATAQFSPEFSIMGQYFFDWKTDRVMSGATYYSFFDNAPGNIAFANSSFAWAGLVGGPKHKSGDWGIAASWRPEWLDGTAGFYFREYTPKNGREFLLSQLGVPGYFFDPDAPRTKLYGVSLSKQMLGISFGAEVNYRKDEIVNDTPFNFVNAAGAGYAPLANTWHGVFNAIAYDGKRDLFGLPLYDSGVLLAELEYGSISHFTRNFVNASFPGNPSVSGFNPACAVSDGGARAGCATKYNVGINILFEPKWFQVWPGTDLTMPLFYGIGLKGNNPSYAPYEGSGSYSIGVAADVDAKYNFKLSYNGIIVKHNRVDSGPLAGVYANYGLGDFSRKDTLNFTAKATW